MFNSNKDINLLEDYLNDYINVDKSEYKNIENYLENYLIVAGKNIQYDNEKKEYIGEYGKIFNLFQSYGWDKDIIEMSVVDTKTEIIDYIKQKQLDAKKSIKELLNADSKITKLIKSKNKNKNNTTELNEILDFDEKLLKLSNIKDSTIYELKSIIKIYILSKQINTDIKNKEYEGLEGKEFLGKFFENINKHLINYTKKNNEIKLLDDKKFLDYNIETGILNFDTNKKSKIDIMFLADSINDKRVIKSNDKHLYGLDVTTDSSGYIDKEQKDSAPKEEYPIIEHSKDFILVKEELEKLHKEKIEGIYLFDSKINPMNNRKLSKFNKENNILEKRTQTKEDLEEKDFNNKINEPVGYLINTITKNYMISDIKEPIEESNKNRIEIKSLNMSIKEMDFKLDIFIKVEEMIASLDLIKDIKNFKEFENLLKEIYVNKNQEIIKNYDIEKINNFIKNIDKAVSLGKKKTNILTEDGKNINNNVSNVFYDFYQHIFYNVSYKKMVYLDLAKAIENNLFSVEKINKIYERFYKNDNKIYLNDVVSYLIKNREQDKKLEEKDKKLEEKDIKSIFNIINDVFIRNEYKCETDKEKENKLKIKLEDLNENDEIDFNKYKSNPLLLKKLILKDESLKTLKYCDLTKLSKEEENYIDSLILLNITKNNTMKIIEKYKPISETVTERLTKKYESLKEIYIKYFKDDDKLNEKLKISIENYLYKKIEEKKPFNNTENSTNFSKDDFESFLKNIKNNNIELLNSEEINNKLNNNYVPNFGM